MSHTIFIKCKVDVMYFIFIFISPSVLRFSVNKSVNKLIKNKRPKYYKPNANTKKSKYLTPRKALGTVLFVSLFA